MGTPESEKTEASQGGVKRFDNQTSELDLAYAKALGIIERDAVRMSDVPKDPEVRAKHERILSGKRAQIERETQRLKKQEAYKYGRVLEALVHDAVLRHGVFGKDTKSLPAAEYDDKINGVDELKELVRPGKKFEYLALAIDTTHGSGTGLDEKFAVLERQRRDGLVTRVDYIKSERNPNLHELEIVPRVVVGVDKKHLDQLISLWLGEKHEALERHPAFTTILQQAVAELTIFRTINERVQQQQRRDLYTRREERERIDQALETQNRTLAILSAILSERLASMSVKERREYETFRGDDEVEKALRIESKRLLSLPLT